MRFVFSAKIILGLVFIALTVAGVFIKSPVDSLPLFTWSNVLWVAGTVFGITLTAKVVQNVKLTNRATPPAYVSWLHKLYSILDPTSGVLPAIGAFVLATLFVYWRIPGFEFPQWFAFHTTFLVFFDTVNVAKK